MIDTDIETVYWIEQETFSDPWSKEDFQTSSKDKNNHYLVVEMDNNVIAYCGYWGIAGEGYIYNVAVKEEYRKQKIGYLMLQELIARGRSQGIKTFTLEVRCSNEAAIRLYKRLGFVNAGVRKDFYTRPKEDALIMWLDPIQ
jgi:ribosomal-protein-alanine N-acetyltransferase